MTFQQMLDELIEETLNFNTAINHRMIVLDENISSGNYDGVIAKLEAEASKLDATELLQLLNVGSLSNPSPEMMEAVRALSLQQRWHDFIRFIGQRHPAHSSGHQDFSRS